jgi:hypothetical protein
LERTEQIKYKERFSIIGVGIFTNAVIVYIGDYVLYPFIIWKLGIIRGGIVMTIISAIVCYATLKFYDWSKQDWLGIEAIKSLKGYGGDKKLGRITAWVMKKSDSIIFLFLSIKFDPFITTAYLRKVQFSGMSKRDWKIFIGSLLFSNAYWTLACYTGITLVEWGWRAVLKGSS